MAIEAAELQEIFLWLDEAEQRALAERPESRERIGDELADILIYLMTFADRYRFDLGSEVVRKLAKNAARFDAL